MKFSFTNEDIKSLQKDKYLIGGISKSLMNIKDGIKIYG